jgi:putative FmdB family regulatory protein
MPIYEYRCAACGHELEALQKISDSPLRKCPECGKSMLKRLMSAPSFRLKGSGWYETDFKNDKEKKRNLVETASSESAPADSESKAGSDDAAKPKKEAAGADKKESTAAESAKPAAKPKPSAASKPRPQKKRAAGKSRSR